MADKLYKLFLTFVVSTMAYGASGEWRVLPIRAQQEFQQGKIGGEAEQHPQDIARSGSNPNVIYLSHDVGQMWRSDDAGATWKKPMCKNLSLYYGNSIEVDPVNPSIVMFYVAYWYDYKHTNKEGLYRSKDGGDTWDFVLPTVTNFDSGNQRIYRHQIAYDKSSSDGSKAMRWYVAFPKNGLYRSENGGDTWTKAADLASYNVIYKTIVHPTNGNVYIGSDQGLYYSTTKGSNLQKLGNLPTGSITSVDINPANPSIIYAVVSGNGLYKSTNGGTTFSLLKSFNALFVFLNPGFPNTLYLVGNSVNAIITHDGGSTWITNMYTVPAPGLGRSGSSWKSKIADGFTGIVPNPTNDNEAVAFSRATIWKTTDGGHSFVDSSTLWTGYAWGWWNNSGMAFDKYDPNRFAFLNFDVGPVVTTTGTDWCEGRNGQAYTWQQQGLISWYDSHSGDFQPVAHSNIIVASIGQTFTMQLMRSTDAGLNWQLPPVNGQAITSSNAATYAENNYFIAFNPNDPNIVYAGNKISTDAGAHFSTVNFGSFASNTPSIIAMCNSAPSTIYAVSSDRYKIYRSDDKGATWRLYTQPGWKIAFKDGMPVIAADPSNANRIYTLNSGGNLARFDGSTWTNFSILSMTGDTGVNFVSNVAVDPVHPEVIYAATYTAGQPCMFRSVDSGAHWEDITNNLPRMGGSSITVNPHSGELLKGGPAGTWIFPAPYASPNTLYNKAYPRPTGRDKKLRDGQLKADNRLTPAYQSDPCTVGSYLIGHYQNALNGFEPNSGWDKEYQSSFGPLGYKAKIVSSVDGKELSSDGRTLDSTSAGVSLSLQSQSGQPVSVNASNELFFKLTDNLDFGCAPITVQKTSGSPGEFCPIYDVRRAIAKNGGVVPLGVLNGSFTSQVPYGAYVIEFDRFLEDLNKDGRVDLKDFAMMAADYGKVNADSVGDTCGLKGIPDRKIDTFDLQAFAEDYLKNIADPNTYVS